MKGKTIEEVYKKIAKMKVSLERGEIVINANTTVDHWFKEWVETYKNAAGLTPQKSKDVRREIQELYSAGYRGNETA